MTGNERRPGLGTGAATSFTSDPATVTRPGDSPTRCTITAEQLKQSGRLFGPAQIIRPVIRAVGCPSQYDAGAGSFVLPLRDLDDVLARLELAGHHVELRLTPW
jgi:hypothetical protein